MHIDCIVILSIIYRSDYDLTLGLLAYFRVAEVDWVQVDMEDKWLGYRSMTAHVTGLKVLNSDPKRRRLVNRTPLPVYLPALSLSLMVWSRIWWELEARIFQD